MPIIKSAIKKLKQDKKHHARNLATKRRYKEAVKTAHQKSSDKQLKRAYSTLDTAVKKKVLHRNKAARLKSQLARNVKS
ncbi:MAG TPA: 30S ribosomal protein S20 [Patescibacteria group bacterium]|nr:30S ribosomal protein S20 [Patescibacteria group bacterium]